MGTPVDPPRRVRITSERRAARPFGPGRDTRMRPANPVVVWTRSRFLSLLFLICLVAAACGGSGDGQAAAPTTATPTTTGASGTTTAAPQVCTDAAALKASVADLDQLDVPEVGKAGLQTALQNIRTRLDTLKGSAGSQWSAQVAELDGAIDTFQTTVAGLDGDNLLGDLPTIVRNLERIDSAWTALEQEIDKTCPKP